MFSHLTPGTSKDVEPHILNRRGGTQKASMVNGVKYLSPPIEPLHSSRTSLIFLDFQHDQLARCRFIQRLLDERTGARIMRSNGIWAHYSRDS